MITIADEVRNPDLPNWEEFGKLIEKTPNDILRVAHTTVRSRLGFADMHLSILRQAEDSSMKRAMCEDVIINLVSTFEAVARVLNGFYALGLDYRFITIDHKFPNSKKKHLELTEFCLRCRLKKVNSRLADILDLFLKTDSPVENWYQSLVEYRHQIMHRQHLIAYSIGGRGPKGYFLPDDPNVMGPGKTHFDKKTKRLIIQNFTQWREIKRYPRESYELVMGIVELIYLAMLEGEK